MLTVENLTRGPEHPARLLRDADRRLRGQDHALPPAVSAALAKWPESHAAAAERRLTYYREARWHLDGSPMVINFMPGLTNGEPGRGLLCYAIAQSNMRAANPTLKISAQLVGLTHRDDEGRLGWTGRVNYVPEHLHDPLHVIKGDCWFSLADTSVGVKCSNSGFHHVRLYLFAVSRLRHVSQTRPSRHRFRHRPDCAARMPSCASAGRAT